MKRSQIAIPFVFMSFGSFSAMASDYAVKVECGGNCGNVQLWKACGAVAAGSLKLKPYAISCADTTNASPNYACGNGPRCSSSIPVTDYQSVSGLCDDRNGNDAIVMCTDGQEPPRSPLIAAPSSVKVECGGNCGNVNFAQICPANSLPIAVSCDDSAAPSTGSVVLYGCGGVSSVACMWATATGEITPNLALGKYCQDGAGYDAVVTCAPSMVGNPLPVRKVVNVECGGNCGNISVGGVCGAIGATTPLQISCSNPATPGSGTPKVCGNGGVCYDYGAVWGTDSLSAYCTDINGWDATVTCE